MESKNAAQKYLWQLKPGSQPLFLKFCCVAVEQLFKLVTTSPLGMKGKNCVFMRFGNLPMDSLWIWTDSGHSLYTAKSQNKINFELKFVRKWEQCCIRPMTTSC